MTKLQRLEQQRDLMIDDYTKWCEEQELDLNNPLEHLGSADEVLFDLHLQKRALNQQIAFVTTFLRDYEKLESAIAREQTAMRKQRDWINQNDG